MTTDLLTQITDHARHLTWFLFGVLILLGMTGGAGFVPLWWATLAIIAIAYLVATGVSAWTQVKEGLL